MYRQQVEKLNRRIFCRFFRRYAESKNRASIGYLEGWTSVAGNALLFVTKYALGVAIGSIALIADAFHTLADILTSLVVVIGFFGSKKPPDKDHPYGHGRIEQLASLAIGLLLLWASFEVLKQAFFKFRNPVDIHGNIGIAFLLLLFAVFKEWMAVFSLQLSALAHSTALKGDAWHHRSDAIATVLVAMSITFSKGTLRYLDPVLGLGVGVMIAYVAVKLCFDTIKQLIGQGILEEDAAKINDIVNCIPQIKDIHAINLHHYGSLKKGSLHIKINGCLSLEEAHHVATQLEERITEELGFQIDVHTEPLEEEA